MLNGIQHRGNGNKQVNLAVENMSNDIISLENDFQNGDANGAIKILESSAKKMKKIVAFVPGGDLENVISKDEELARQLKQSGEQKINFKEIGPYLNAAADSWHKMSKY